MIKIRQLNTSAIKWPLCKIDCLQWPTTEIINPYSFDQSSSTTLNQVQGEWGDHFIAGIPDSDKQAVHYNIAKSIGLEHCHITLQTQMPGQQMTMHFDAGSRSRFSFLSDLEHKELVKRAFVFLEDWQEGQVIQMAKDLITHWTKGQVLAFDWTNVKHGTANFGTLPRPMLCVTGTTTVMFEDLWHNNDCITIPIH